MTFLLQLRDILVTTINGEDIYCFAGG